MHGGGAEHVWDFVQLSSCALKPPLSLAGLTSYPEALLLQSNSPLVLEHLGRVPPASQLLETKAGNGTEHRPGGWKGQRGCLFCSLEDCLACVELTYWWQERSLDLKVETINQSWETFSSFGVIGCCKWMHEAGGMWEEAWAVLKPRLCLV